MSGVSHYVTKTLPPSRPGISGHDWRKSGNPPPTNYFKTREMNFNDCLNEPYFDEYYTTDYEPYYDGEFVEYSYDPCYESSAQVIEQNQTKPNETDDVTVLGSSDKDFRITSKSDTLK